ncbi:MAG: ribonucleoside-diphosphate reductase subunit alpha [Gammaproteobacteria bacterium]|nr:ribonucleoside-diphosphate reductase subunit alpha [Gammaproteobacteria bacterium]
MSAESTAQSSSNQYQVIRRNGQVTNFDSDKIAIAITKAFLAVEGDSAKDSRRIHDTVSNITQQITDNLTRRLDDGGTVHIEDIQDQVELVLMRTGEYKAARAYVLYREQQTQKRVEEEKQHPAPVTESSIQVTAADGSKHPLDITRLQNLIIEACAGLDGVDSAAILHDTQRNIFDGVAESDVEKSLVMSARTFIEKDPAYSTVSSRLLMDSIRREALSFVFEQARQASQHEMADIYPEYFKNYIQRAIDHELLAPELAEYDLDKLGDALKPENDFNFTYLGLQTLYDRYFIHQDNVRFELPQAFYMRVSMGLAINEINREERAIEFYNLLSSFDFMSSTPTLFNAGTLRPQLSSCYLTTIPDDLGDIYSAMRDNALLSKFAGGLGNDWTQVRGLGSHIKGTNGNSQGVVPFLKVANDTAVAVNQGGKRKGAVCAYLETWHIDIEEFLDLRKNTGDDRRRTHDMNTANWIPDLFMKRVAENGDWTLFSPEETPDLHDLMGLEFEAAYTAYEQKAARGEIRNTKTLPANDLWRKMLGMLFETGHPWITFKDPCNLRSPQQHVGVVHSSNLCTEITLNTSDDEIAVCNLGSVNLPQHIDENGLNLEKLQRTIKTAMRMLDNVIEYNYYSVPQARKSNLQHRPVGLGIMGFQDALYKMRLPYSSDDAVGFADTSMEAVSYFTIEASSDLAAERGSYKSYEGSLWSQGILPIDSIQILKDARGDYLQQDQSQTLDWDSLRNKIKQQGMRNSNTMAIAPTATISNICGVSQSVEPTYQNLFVKSNLSGEFTVINPYMVDDLKSRGLWDDVMINDLKYFDGSLQSIDRVPDELKALYVTAFEMDARWLIEAASRRQKWLDQAQSLNLYMAEPSGKKMDNLYKLAWVRGLKTTYYLRSMGATAAEKTSSVVQAEPAVVAPTAPAPVVAAAAAPAPVEAAKVEEDEFVLGEGQDAPQACSILEPDCEACQ